MSIGSVGARFVFATFQVTVSVERPSQLVATFGCVTAKGAPVLVTLTCAMS